MKKIILFSFLLLKLLNANAQSQNWLWAKGAGGINEDNGQSVTTDASGNVIVTGFFRSTTITFGSTTLTNADTNNTADIFITKYDALGNVVWAKRAGGTGDDVGNSINTSANGNICITGYYLSGSITFGSFTLTNSNSTQNIFIVKYDSSGNVIWANNAGKFGTAAAVNGNSVSFDGNGNVFVTGYFSGYWFTGNYIIFGSTTLTDTIGGGNIFVVKYDTSGNALWAKNSAKSSVGASADEGYGISTDTIGNVYVTGYFKSYAIIFDIDTLYNTGGSSCSINGCKDIFLVKYDASGNVLWAKSAGGYNNDDLGWSIKTDVNGNIYLTGQVQSYTISFGSITLTNPGNYFLVKYDASGNALWAKCTANGNSNNAIGKSLSTDVNSNVYVTGYFLSQTVTFGSTTLTNAGGSNNTYDIFILKYDSSGNVIWGNSVGNVNYDWGYGINVDTSGMVFVTGYFQSSSITFGSTWFPNTNSSTSNFFVAKLCQSPSTLTVTTNGPTTFCQGDSVTLTASTSTSYLWNNGATTQSITVSTSGNYSVTVTYTNGCSATANVVVTQVAISITSTQTFVPCNGDSNGSATATAIGGTSPYTYLWNDPFSQTATAASGLAGGTYLVTVIDSNTCSATNNVLISQHAAIIITTTQNNVYCNGDSNGTITATASGGLAPYTFLWNDASSQSSATATGLPAGTYKITVSDLFTCITTANVVVTQPVVLAVTASAIGVLCNGGSTGTTSATPSNGTSPYAYLWNDSTTQTTASATGLSAGTFTVTVTDANSCTVTASQTVTQSVAIPVTTSSTGVLCNGGVTGTATATASGSTSPFAYSWNDAATQSTATATGLTAGTFAVTVTDANSCTVTASQVVTQPVVLAVSASATAVLCNGGSTGTAIATPTGGTSPFAYSWNDSATQTTATATGLTAGTYTVTVTDANSCTKSASQTVTEPTALSVTVTVAQDGATTKGKATASPTGGTSPYAYSWSDGNSQTTTTATGLTAGTYNVTVTDANSCTKTGSIVAPLYTGIQPALSDLQSEITIYPNPTDNGIFTVQWLTPASGLVRNDETIAYVQNLLGEVIFEKELNTSGANLLDLSKQSPGMYFLHLRNEVNAVVRKIVLTH